MTTDLHNAITEALRAAFTVETLPTCAAYPELGKKLKLPGVLIELSELAPDEDPGTDELGLIARFTVYIVLERSSTAKLEAANLAAAVALNVYKSGRFGQDVGRATGIRAVPDEFKPELFGYVVWAVEWSHEIRIGESIWNGEGITPSEIYLGIAPNIGAAHAGDYHQVTGLPE